MNAMTATQEQAGIIPDRPTTETAFGPAEYTVSPDGAVSLSWPAGVTVNRVFYPRASVYGQRYGDRHSGQPSLSRKHWPDHPTFAAVDAVREEHARLAPLLATPERIARAHVEAAEYAVQCAERECHAAEEKAARARAALVGAQAALDEVRQEHNAA